MSDSDKITNFFKMSKEKLQMYPSTHLDYHSQKLKNF